MTLDSEGRVGIPVTYPVATDVEADFCLRRCKNSFFYGFSFSFLFWM